jgi:hypothetical protein
MGVKLKIMKRDSVEDYRKRCDENTGLARPTCDEILKSNIGPTCDWKENRRSVYSMAI